MRALNAYSKFLDALTRVLRVILICLLSAMVLIMFFQVVMRYVFSNAQPWCEELTLYLSIACIFLGLGIATRKDSHLQVDFLIRMYGPRLKCLMTAICSIVAVVVMIVFAIYSLSLILQHATAKSVTLPVTMAQIYVIFPVGSVLVCLYSFEIIAKNLIGFMNGGKLPTAEGGKDA